MQLSHDDRGPHLVVPFERADDVRAALISLGVLYEEDAQPGAGCAGPVWTVLRLDEVSLERAGGESALLERI